MVRPSSCPSIPEPCPCLRRIASLMPGKTKSCAHRPFMHSPFHVQVGTIGMHFFLSTINMINVLNFQKDNNPRLQDFTYVVRKSDANSTYPPELFGSLPKSAFAAMALTKQKATKMESPFTRCQIDAEGL